MGTKMKKTSNIIQKGLNRIGFSLRLCDRKRRHGVFTIHPDGAMDTNTFTIIERKAEQIIKLAPKVIIFDMQNVDYINSRGLRVILTAQLAIIPGGGRVVLVNLQPHIKEVFDIIDALPAQRIFANRHELDNYLDAMQSRCDGAGQKTIPRTKPSVSIGTAAEASAAGGEGYF